MMIEATNERGKAMKTINLPVKQWTSDDGQGILGQVGPVCEREYSEAKLRGKLQAAIMDSLTYHANALKNYQQHAIGTKDGSVLIMLWRGNWEYSIVGNERKYGSATVSNWDERECYAAMKRHAEDYGGILWETTF